MADDLLGRISDLLKRRRPWYTLPRFLAAPQLVEIRNQLRQENLHDTEEPTLQEQPVPPNLDPALRNERTVDGTYNDLKYPTMGACGRRFGRNVPLNHTFPDLLNLVIPSPRVVSRELMTRHEFQSVPILNLLAAAWIQFMVHDWFVHKRSSLADGIEIPLAPGDDWSETSMKVPRSVPEPAPAGSKRPPAYANPNSHWWDGSQVYGSDAQTAAKLRSGEGGHLKVAATKLLPVDPDTGAHLAGFTDNWWVGLALLHTLFTLEHNRVADLLAVDHPGWNDAQLFGKAKLINSALMARIHTLEWTPAILPHPLIQLSLRTNWYGLKGEEAQDVLEFLDDSEILGGVVGSRADHHGTPYSLTEEFVSVYRMHPLIPDDVVFRSFGTDAEIETLSLPAMSGRHAPGIFERLSMMNLLYTFGRTHPGAITLHNYPKHLQNLTTETGEHFDLAAVDILRDRERGVPRYNEFLRLFHKEPLKSFDELTENPTWRKELKTVYANDLEKIDLMTGLFAEPLPEGFGFSETAFRLFILMASRRLKSDRFFTDDYRPEIYTEFGLNYLRETTMLSVIRHHYPALAPALEGVENAFQPWRVVQAPASARPMR